MERLRKIIHIDMDAFFASVEQRDNPELRGKPVAVGGSAQRGVVAAASYEARKFGVKSALPSVTAKRHCPNLIFVKPRFDQYKRVSNQIREIFAEYTPLIEPLSLDEAYLDVTENLKGIETATEIARQIRQKVKEQTQLTASAGVSFNKFLAKTASDVNKPDGMFVIKPHQAQAFVEKLEVRRFFGIGKVTAEKMVKLGIFTGKELREKSLEYLVNHFGKAGQYYYEICRGEDHRQVNPERIRKSVGVENTFKTDYNEPDDLYRELDIILEELQKRLQRSKAYGKTVTLKIKYQDFEQITRSRTSQLLIMDQNTIGHMAYELLNALLPLNKGVRLMGVTLSNLEFADEIEGRQLTLDF
ncbi:DNA polymerase IV [Jiulongibacter sediminis]|uniref:DNA polymerase IV n=1 Tax=Jiulongibacter sediminis TaxID=1605367 RepID=A0A0N8H9Y5_9BACT|nr:DNA polymerase IV [Jiulongibacter sediminis]KPM48668.1 DNA repair protein [Jiulongibacter sediminis]TBX25204.1 DNA repair protein [Jiulongibacter sediminis]